jgi:hypothetical protein
MSDSPLFILALGMATWLRNLARGMPPGRCSWPSCVYFGFRIVEYGCRDGGAWLIEVGFNSVGGKFSRLGGTYGSRRVSILGSWVGNPARWEVHIVSVCLFWLWKWLWVSARGSCVFNLSVT